MRVEIEQGIVVCDTDSDWKDLPENEHEFLYKCYSYWEGFTKSGKLKWYKLSSNRAETEEWRMRSMITHAYTCNVEVSQDVLREFERIKEQAKEELLLKERLAFLESKRRKWATRERDGCEGCMDCIRVGDGWFKCGYSGDDLETRFSEVWDPVTQCMIIFHEVGVPNAHCKDYYQERKEFGR